MQSAPSVPVESQTVKQPFRVLIIPYRQMRVVPEYLIARKLEHTVGKVLSVVVKVRKRLLKRLKGVLRKKQRCKVNIGFSLIRLPCCLKPYLKVMNAGRTLLM